MNELEKEISKESLSLKYCDRDEINAFEDGAMFVLSKNLDEQFAEWMMTNCYRCREGYLYNYEPSQNPIKTISEMKKFWINNIYGK